MDDIFPTNESYQKLFLRGYPIKLLVPVIMEYLSKQHDFESQKKFVESTFRLPLIKQYPLKVEYMQSLLKLIILELEEKKVEVCDEFYEICCELMNTSSDEDMTHYRHYMLSDSLEKCITVQESTRIISQGTTGLHTWQASQALVNWCISQKSKLENKCVLELGSGIGLAGLAVCSECAPGAFWFSDCHTSVLGMLLSNVKINVDRENDLKSLLSGEKHNFFKVNSFGMPNDVEENILYQGKMKKTDVYVMNLPWENIVDSNISKAICPDLVLAADVVYDTSSLKPLCEALSHLVNESCIAIVACTIRNEDTLNEFLELMGKSNITFDMNEPLITFEFLNLEDVPVRIYKLFQKNVDCNIIT